MVVSILIFTSMNFWFLISPVFIIASLGVWLHVLWRERRAIITDNESLDQKITALFFFYMGVSVAGFGFPVLDNGTIMLGATPALMWVSVLLSFPMAWFTYSTFQRFENINPMLFTILLWFMLSLFNVGWIALFNGALDFKPAQTRQVRLLKKDDTSSWKGGRMLVFYSSDWNQTRGRVRFKAPNSLFQTSKVGDTLELQVRRGAFGVEWLQGVRNLSR